MSQLFAVLELKTRGVYTCLLKLLSKHLRLLNPSIQNYIYIYRERERERERETPQLTSDPANEFFC